MLKTNTDSQNSIAYWENHANPTKQATQNQNKNLSVHEIRIKIPIKIKTNLVKKYIRFWHIVLSKRIEDILEPGLLLVEMSLCKDRYGQMGKKYKLYRYLTTDVCFLKS